MPLHFKHTLFGTNQAHHLEIKFVWRMLTILITVNICLTLDKILVNDFFSFNIKNGYRQLYWSSYFVFVNDFFVSINLLLNKHCVSVDCQFIWYSHWFYNKIFTITVNIAFHYLYYQDLLHFVLLLEASP
jgi:hypothetical protein